LNIIKGTFAALKSQKTAEDIARMRGKKVVDVEAHYYGYGLRK
jgi:ribosomal protein S5